ncbi:MAG: host attachment protein [Planctomycetes bacterium]|nr:host attachment protein [Planctomycetota bacterium]
MNRRTWIVVSDSSRARIFLDEETGSDWNLVGEIDFPDGRKRVEELVSDQPGSVQQTGMGGGKAGLTPTIDPKEKEAIRFARSLSELLEKSRRAHAFDQLVITAPAHFLGLLRKSLDDETTKLVIQTAHHDYTRNSAVELQELVAWEN